MHFPLPHEYEDRADYLKACRVREAQIQASEVICALAIEHLVSGDPVNPGIDHRCPSGRGRDGRALYLPTNGPKPRTILDEARDTPMSFIGTGDGVVGDR